MNRHLPINTSRLRARLITALSTTLLVLTFLFWLPLSPEAPLPAAQAQEADLTADMDIFSLDGNTLMYRAVRTITHRGGQVTEKTVYQSLSGKTLVETVAVFEAQSLAPVSYRYQDLRSGETEPLDRQGNTVQMSYVKQSGEGKDEGSEAHQPGKIISAAVTPFIQRNRETLLAGKSIEFRLLVPSRQDSVGFQVTRDTKIASPSGTFTIRMDPSSWLIRKLVDPLYLTLENKPPYRLVLYRGRGAVKTEDLKDQDLYFSYKYR